MKKIISIFLIIFCVKVYAQNKMQVFQGFDSLYVSQKTEADLNSAFDIIKDVPISLNDKTEKANNCENRAEFGFYVLQKLGFKPVNFWILKEGLVDPSFKTSKSVRKSNGLAFNTHLGRNPMVFWAYHVASGVIVNNDGKLDTLIFDPWTQQGKLVSLKEWSLSFFQEVNGRTISVFPVTGLYKFYGTTSIGQLDKTKEAWLKNIDNDFNQMFCGLCGITPNSDCDKNRNKGKIATKRAQIIEYLKKVNINF